MLPRGLELGRTMRILEHGMAYKDGDYQLMLVRIKGHVDGHSSSYILLSSVEVLD